jgi:hypothetical protein
MIRLENIALWDAASTVTRVPLIEINPEMWLNSSDDEKWIVCGPWKIKITVEPTGSGLSVKDMSGKTMSSAMSGSMFLDDSMFTIAPVSSEFTVLGSARGCFDISW